MISMWRVLRVDMVTGIFSKREKYIFTAAVIFISMALLYNFIVEPGIKRWKILNSEIAAKKAVMDNGIRLIERREGILREYDQYAKFTKNISKVLSDVENKADSLNVKTSNIKPGMEIDKGLYKEYSMELQIEGEMQDIIKFLSELAKLPTFVISKKFDFRLIEQNPPIFKGTVILSKIII